MQNNPDAIREALRMAQSAEGQQLMQLLQQCGGQELSHAMNQAAAGDYRAAKAIVNGLMKDPRAQALLKQMGGSYGSDGR